MATITIEYDNKNEAAKTALERLFSKGLIREKRSVSVEWTKAEEREAFLHTSKVNAAKIFSKHL